MVASIRPMPSDITRSIIIGITACNIYIVGRTLKTAPTPTSTTSDIKNVIKLEIIVDITYIYFGTYTFLIIAALPLIALSPDLVEEEKNENKRRPESINTGYVLSSRPNNVPNTIVSTIIVSSGSTRVHKIPKYERRYFNLIFFFTNSNNKYL